jgi:hypothetical protein
MTGFFPHERNYSPGGYQPFHQQRQMTENLYFALIFII